MKYIILIVVFGFFCIACSGTQTTIGYGIPTNIHSLDKKWSGDSHKLLKISTRKNNLELVFNNYLFDMQDEKFQTQSAGIVYHLAKRWDWFFVDGGIGLHLANTNKKNYLLAESHLLGDLNVNTGIIFNLERAELKIMYTLQHISVPCRSDRGLNYDMLQVKFDMPHDIFGR